MMLASGTDVSLNDKLFANSVRIIKYKNPRI